MTISTTLASLIHHIELNNAGWRDQTLSYMALSIISELGAIESKEALANQMNERFGVIVDIRTTDGIIRQHETEGRVIHSPDGKISLSESARVMIKEHADETVALEERVIERFSTVVTACCPEANLHWDYIRDSFLEPLAASLGARLYLLLRDTKVTEEIAGNIPRLDQGWGEDIRKQVVEAISRFIDPNDSDIRAYMLRLLNTNLLVKASAVSEEDLRAVQISPSQRLSMRVFVDTNILFSIMGLHENPADDSAEALFQLVRNLSDRLDVKFVALPITIDEARRTISGYAASLRKIRLTPNLISALDSKVTELGGITLKFMNEFKKSKGRFSVDSFLGPYLTNFVTVMRGLGIELHNAKTDSMRTEQPVVDDILEQLEWEKSRRKDRAKSYDALEHDMILWHFVKRQRPASVDSPLQAHYWIGTIDFRLISFDEHKRRAANHSLPVCIHPTTMLQMLQFWVPRTQQLENALIRSLWPLLPHAFDKHAEEVTLNILSAISRYSDAGDLSDDTISSVLMSEGLRARMSAAKSDDDQLKLVESEILHENDRLRHKWESEQKRAKSLAASLDEQNQKSQEMAEDNKRQLQGLKENFHQLSEDLAKSNLEREQLRQDLEKERQRRKRLRSFIKFILYAIASAVIYSGLTWLLFLLVRWKQWQIPVEPWLLVTTFIVAPTWCFIETLAILGNRDGNIQHGTIVGIIRKFRTGFRLLLSSVIIGILCNIVWLGVKSQETTGPKFTAKLTRFSPATLPAPLSTDFQAPSDS